jgi:hypothetical protein
MGSPLVHLVLIDSAMLILTKHILDAEIATRNYPFLGCYA